MNRRQLADRSTLLPLTNCQFSNRLRARHIDGHCSSNTNFEATLQQNGGPNEREQELIQKLEEATDEIETLLNERDRLVNVSNKLKYELQQTNAMLSSRNECETAPLQTITSPRKNRNHLHDQAMLDVILNDQSNSYDSESHDESENYSRVACIGMKPPLSNGADVRPSKSAYVSTWSCVVFSILQS